MHSLKTKLILAISALVIFLFSITALLLVDEKRKEISRDIYFNARSFSELTTPKIVDLYNSLLAEKSFFIFNREIKDVFAKNNDVAQIRVYTFGGDMLYDSVTERERGYEGPMRTVKDEALLKRIRSVLPSYFLNDGSGRLVYLKKDAEGNYLPVDENEAPAPEIKNTDEIQNIVFPHQGKFVVEFAITYENLRARVIRTTERIVLLLVFGILLGLGFGWFFSERITNPIERLRDGALVIGKGDFTARVQVASKDEVGVLAETFNKMAQDLEVSTKALVFKERLAKELELAEKMQKQIIPLEVPKIPGLDLATAIIPAAEIGGDTYDFIQVDPETNIIYISDVTGHGIPAGIVVSIANALIYSYSVSSASLKELLINTNRVLRKKIAPNMNMTLLMLRYQKNAIQYVSAGHPEMLHYFGADRKVITEKGGGIAVGMIPDITKVLTENTVSFSPGDCIVLYSDGIPDAMSEKGERYGMQRLKRILNDAGELQTALAIKNALLADVKLFMGKAEQPDDITMVVMRRKA